jgi:hypothetical protein
MRFWSIPSESFTNSEKTRSVKKVQNKILSRIFSYPKIWGKIMWELKCCLQSHIMAQLLSVWLTGLESFIFVKTNWPRLVQNLLWIYTVSCNENSVYWVITNNFVITLFTGTYWNKYPLYSLYLPCY